MSIALAFQRVNFGLSLVLIPLRHYLGHFLSIAEQFFDHIVVINGDRVFTTRGYDQKEHNIKGNTFVTMLSVDPDGEVWANNPFPVRCSYEVFQDSHALRLGGGLRGGNPAHCVGSLAHRDGESTTIRMCYELSEDADAAVRQFTPPLNRAYSFGK
jgi:hypothetical protein